MRHITELTFHELVALNRQLIAAVQAHHDEMTGVTGPVRPLTCDRCRPHLEGYDVADPPPEIDKPTPT